MRRAHEYYANGAGGDLPQSVYGVAEDQCLLAD